MNSEDRNYEILLVDDENSLLEQSKIFLEKENGNLSVDTAISAREGLSKFSENNYDVIVSDYQMPEMDGLDFLKEIREVRDSDIPFIIFTG